MAQNDYEREITCFRKNLSVLLGSVDDEKVDVTDPKFKMSMLMQAGFITALESYEGSVIDSDSLKAGIVGGFVGALLNFRESCMHQGVSETDVANLIDSVISTTTSVISQYTGGEEVDSRLKVVKFDIKKRH